MGESIPLYHEDTATAIKNQAGAVFKFLKTFHDHQIFRSGPEPEIFPWNLITGKWRKNNKGLIIEIEENEG